MATRASDMSYFVDFVEPWQNPLPTLDQPQKEALNFGQRRRRIRARVRLNDPRNSPLRTLKARASIPTMEKAANPLGKHRNPSHWRTHLQEKTQVHGSDSAYCKQRSSCAVLPDTHGHGAPQLDANLYLSITATSVNDCALPQGPSRCPNGYQIRIARLALGACPPISPA